MKLKDFVLFGEPDFYETTSSKILNNIYFSHPRDIDLFELCEIYGMTVNTNTENLNLSIAANVDRQGVITVSESLDEVEFRQVLAEEFSHLYLHQNNQISENVIYIDKIEAQAQKLAANILMPTEWLLDIDVCPVHNEMKILAGDVAEQFYVTPEYAYRRLKQLNKNYLFDVGTTKYLFSLPQYYLPPKIYVVLDDEQTFYLK